MDSDSDDESYIIEAERKAKQNYLSEEIIENNYDPELFMMFCGSRKEANIDAWTFDELQECVHEFKMTYRRGQSLKEVQEAQMEEKAKSKKTEKPVIVEPEPTPKPQVQEKPKEVIIKSAENPVNKKAPEPSPLDTQKITSPPKPAAAPVNQPIVKESEVKPVKPVVPKEVIVEPEVKEISEVEDEKTKFVTDSVHVEAIEDKKAEVEVEIKDNKFIIKCIQAEVTELSSLEGLIFEIGNAELVQGGFFSSNYYLYSVLTLPAGWQCKRRFSEFVWLREMLVLSLPGNYIPPIPSRKSRSGSQEDLLKKRRKILSKFTAGLARNKLLLTMSFVEQFFKVAYGPEFTEYQKATKKKVKKPESVEFYTTLDGNANCDISFQGARAEKLMHFAEAGESIEKKLKRQAQNVMADIKSMQGCFNELSELVHSLEEAQTLPYTADLKRLYSYLSQSFKSISEQEEKRCSIFQEYFNMYFKYSYLEKNTMKEVLKERESILSDYNKSELKKKNLDRLRNQFGFINCKLLEEVERTIREETIIMNQHFIKFSHEKVELATDLHSVWSKLIENLGSI